MRPRACRREAGFTFIGLIAALAIIALMLTMAARVWSAADQRDKEQQLLFIGEQFRMAIARYYAFGHQYPLSLQDLLEDKRTPVPRRHLRQLYRDPFTREADWHLIMDPTNIGIMGVASQSTRVPIKRAGFGPIEIGFADSKCYCDWQFTYTPPAFLSRGLAAPQGGLTPPSGLQPGAPAGFQPAPQGGPLPVTPNAPPPPQQP